MAPHSALVQQQQRTTVTPRFPTPLQNTTNHSSQAYGHALKYPAATFKNRLVSTAKCSDMSVKSTLRSDSDSSDKYGKTRQDHPTLPGNTEVISPRQQVHGTIGHISSSGNTVEKLAPRQCETSIILPESTPAVTGSLGRRGQDCLNAPPQQQPQQQHYRQYLPQRQYHRRDRRELKPQQLMTEDNFHNYHNRRHTQVQQQPAAAAAQARPQTRQQKLLQSLASPKSTVASTPSNFENCITIRCSCENPDNNHAMAVAAAVKELCEQQIKPSFSEIRRRLQKDDFCNWFYLNCPQIIQKEVPKVPGFEGKEEICTDRSNSADSEASTRCSSSDIFCKKDDDTTDTTIQEFLWTNTCHTNFESEDISFDEEKIAAEALQEFHDDEDHKLAMRHASELLVNAQTQQVVASCMSLIGEKTVFPAELGDSDLSTFESSDSSVNSQHAPQSVAEWLTASNCTLDLLSIWHMFLLHPARGNAEPFVTFRMAPATFTGFVDPADKRLPYPPSAISVAALYLLILVRRGGGSLRAGRFLMAQELKNRGPPQLRRLTLGQLCHLVQLLLTLRFIAYDSHYIRPVVACEALTKAVWARLSRAMVPTQSPAIQKIRAGVKELLRMHSGGIVLSQLRNTYEAYFCEPLEFNNLGYTKLAIFLREQLSDACRMVPTGPFNALVVSTDETCDEGIGDGEHKSFVRTDSVNSSSSSRHDCHARLKGQFVGTMPPAAPKASELVVLDGHHGSNDEDDDTSTHPSEGDSWSSEETPCFSLHSERTFSLDSLVEPEKDYQRKNSLKSCSAMSLLQSMRQYRDGRQISYNFWVAIKPTTTTGAEEEEASRQIESAAFSSVGIVCCSSEWELPQLQFQPARSRFMQ